MDIKLKIRNWKTYNARRDKATSSWFRVQNGIGTSRDLHRLSASQKWAWICLLALAGQGDSEEVDFDAEWLADTHRLEISDVLHCIVTLSGKCIELLSPTQEELSARLSEILAHKRPTNGTVTHHSCAGAYTRAPAGDERTNEEEYKKLKSAEQVRQKSQPPLASAADADTRNAEHCTFDKESGRYGCEEQDPGEVAQLSLVPTESNAVLTRSHRVKSGVVAQIQATACTGVSEVPPARNSLEGKKVAFLIGVYVKAWQKRYATTARPDVGGKSQGVLKRLVASRTPEELSELLQVYCQMRVPWFETKCHDLVTFETNVGKIALAREKGHESTWDEKIIFGDTEEGGENGTV